VHPLSGLLMFSNSSGIDFSEHPLDEPLQNLEVQGSRGQFQMIQKLSEKEGLTLKDVGQAYGRSVLVPQLVGTPTQIADELEALFREEAGDGFIISPAYLPGSFDEFVDLVVPELQKRGLFRKEYTGSTLKDSLGRIARPE
jgi:alkanesulfonate monooxygenase SsuD/methylene tetrahydromethanopterin reductase-like flavin-dependent oxidoreductase (luciferase family)